MDNLKVIPYTTAHAQEMIKYGMNDPLMDIDCSYLQNYTDVVAPGLSFTLVDGVIPIVSGGIYPLWQGTAEGWVLSSKRIFNYKIKSAALIKRRLDMLCVNNKIWRLQTAVKSNFKLGVRFAEWLGLQQEGLMKQYGPDKTDYYRMAKIYTI
jgi:hypothetical protein